MEQIEEMPILYWVDPTGEYHSGSAIPQGCISVTERPNESYIWDFELREWNNNLAWADVRSKRDSILRESDWTMLEDVPFDTDKKNEWKAYRKALRDITKDFELPWEVVWPTKPSE